MQEDSVDLFELVRTIWRGRVVVLAVAAVFAIGGLAYVWMATEWFKADVVMIPADQNKSLSGNLSQLSGLASLAGLNIGQDGAPQESIAVLKSKELARDFITDKNLIKVLLVDKLDPGTGNWKIQDPAKQPDIRDAVDYFQKKILSVNEDKKAGVVTLSVMWRDPVVAADWANELAKRVNTILRDQAVTEADRNIAYLKDEMAATNITSMQQSIGRVMESEMQKLLLARGNDEFAFKVVDRAVAPRKPEWPQRLFTVVASTVVGVLLAFVLVIMRHGVRDRQSSKAAMSTSATPHYGAAR